MGPLTDDYYIPGVGYPDGSDLDPYKRPRGTTQFQQPPPLAPQPPPVASPQGGGDVGSSQDQPQTPQSPSGGGNTATLSFPFQFPLTGIPPQPSWPKGGQIPSSEESEPQAPQSPQQPPQMQSPDAPNAFDQAAAPLGQVQSTFQDAMRPGPYRQEISDLHSRAEAIQDSPPSAWRQVLASMMPGPLQALSPLVAYGPQGMRQRQEKAKLEGDIKRLEPLATAEDLALNRRMQAAEGVTRLTETEQARQSTSQKNVEAQKLNAYKGLTNTWVKELGGVQVGSRADIPHDGKYTLQTVVNPETSQPEYYAIPDFDTKTALEAKRKLAEKTVGYTPIGEGMSKVTGLPVGTLVDPKDILAHADVLLGNKGKPISQDEADKLNGTWDSAIKQSKLPTPAGQFKAGMTSDEVGKLITSLNDSMSRAQGGQRLEIQMDKGDPQAEREYMAVRANMEKQFETYQKQADAIAEAKRELAGGFVGQAVGTVKFLSSLAAGMGSGVRITQAELNNVLKARGIVGDFQGWVGGLIGAGKIPASQLKQMQEVLDGVLELAQQKERQYSDNMDKLGSARTRDDIRKVEKEFRQSILGVSPPVPPVGSSPKSSIDDLVKKYGGKK